MAIVIKKIIESIDRHKLLVEAQHYNELIIVYLSSENWEQKYLDKEVIFEMDFEKVLNWKVIDSKFGMDSGLFSDEQNTILIRGEVHNILEVEDDAIIDIYISKGAEFLAITSSDIDNCIPVIGTGIELRIEGVCIYPVHY